MPTTSFRTDLPWHIYVLIDPRIGRERYVGWTHFPKRRLREHYWEAVRKQPHTHKSRWFRNLLKEGYYPTMEILESGFGDHCLNLEKEWISWYRKRGYPLVNTTLGGDGASGYSHSPETIKKISDAHFYHPEKETHVKKLVAGRRKAMECPERRAAWRARLSESHKGYVPTDEQRRKQSVNNLGKHHPVFTPETRRRMSEAAIRRWARGR